jgi:SAM-dependent methyltransferase
MAGDYDYEAGGGGYATQRRTDPRIAAYVHAALGDARSVVNVGAGAGSYEPEDRLVIAVEPSAAMRGQRPAHLAPAISAVAGALPFDDDSFDAALATVTVHQWPDAATADRSVRRLRHDLESGAWDRRFGSLRSQPELIGALRLITARPA